MVKLIEESEEECTEDALFWEEAEMIQEKKEEEEHYADYSDKD